MNAFGGKADFSQRSPNQRDMGTRPWVTMRPMTIRPYWRAFIACKSPSPFSGYDIFSSQSSKFASGTAESPRRDGGTHFGDVSFLLGGSHRPVQGGGRRIDAHRAGGTVGGERAA